MKYSYLFILILFSSNFLIAGDDCAELKEQYRKAERSYTDGDLYKAISLLDNITNKSLRNCLDVERDAFSLLTKLYLLINEDEKATENYKQVLKKDPTYKPNEALEPMDLIYFSSRYRAIPMFSITPEFYLINTREKEYGKLKNRRVRSIEGVYASEKDNSLTDYRRLFSIGGGIKGSFFPTRHWEVSLGYSYERREFQMEKNSQRTIGVVTSEESIIIEESQEWNNISSLIKYNLGKKAFNFNVFVGFERNFLHGAYFIDARRGDFNLINVADAEGKDYIYKANNKIPIIDIEELRSEKNSSLFFGFGLKYRQKKQLNRNYFTFNIISKRDLDAINYNENDLEKMDENDLRRDLIFGLGYIEDEIYLSSIQFSIGYSYTIYRVIEKGKRLNFGR